MNQYGFDGLEQKIGYIYKDKKLLRQAMTHTSFANEQKMNKLKSYERIEFLGDAILEMVSSEFFYFTYPDLPEGKLTQMRASSVCEQALAITARDLSLGSYMLVGVTETPLSLMAWKQSLALFIWMVAWHRQRILS